MKDERLFEKKECLFLDFLRVRENRRNDLSELSLFPFVLRTQKHTHSASALKKSPLSQS
jgi:hypothetical protein